MSFDLNIDNYTKNELAEMFDLPANYDKNILDMKESKLRESIINNKEINTDIKEKTIQFLIKAKTILNTPDNQNIDFNTKMLDFLGSSYKLKPSKLEDPEEHMVQVRQDNPYLASFPSEFFPGVINPLKRRVIRKSLNIDTRFRENYFASPSTNFNITLPTNFNNVLQMQLATIELPTTYYNVSKQYGNNFFTITVNTSTSVVTIPD
jgi:hypothetical protein